MEQFPHSRTRHNAIRPATTRLRPWAAVARAIDSHAACHHAMIGLRLVHEISPTPTPGWTAPTATPPAGPRDHRDDRAGACARKSRRNAGRRRNRLEPKWLRKERGLCECACTCGGSVWSDQHPPPPERFGTRADLRPRLSHHTNRHDRAPNRPPPARRPTPPPCKPMKPQRYQVGKAGAKCCTSPQANSWSLVKLAPKLSALELVSTAR